MQPDDLAKSGNEFGEQSALFCYFNSAEARARFPQFYRKPEGDQLGRCKMYSINNNAGVDADAKTRAIRGGRAKQIGLLPGVADIFIPLARHGCNGLYIELKIDPEHPENVKCNKKGVQSPTQRSFEKQVTEDNFGYCVCEGWKRAKAVISQYLS